MGGRSSSRTDLRVELAAARRRAEQARVREPHAAAASFDPGTRRLRIELTNGARIELPTALVPELHEVEDAVLADVVVGPAGLALRWERIDQDLSVVGLLRLLVGTRALMRASGVAGGSVRSEAKARAARQNGRKGGRPRRRVVRE